MGLDEERDRGGHRARAISVSLSPDASASKGAGSPFRFSPVTCKDIMHPALRAPHTPSTSAGVSRYGGGGLDVIAHTDMVTPSLARSTRALTRPASSTSPSPPTSRYDFQPSSWHQQVQERGVIREWM